MGSSKSAQALITKFNYEEKGLKVWLIKPSIDTREELNTVSSRIGLKAECTAIFPDMSIWDEFENRIAQKVDVIIADESQFFTAAQIDDMRKIVDELEVPVLCFGLRTDFRTHLFEGGFILSGRGGVARANAPHALRRRGVFMSGAGQARPGRCCRSGSAARPLPALSPRQAEARRCPARAGCPRVGPAACPPASYSYPSFCRMAWASPSADPVQEIARSAQAR